MSEEFFDVVVVGSGFGGAVTACRVAEAGRKVLVLERGKLYQPGEFPRSPLEMSTNFWDPSEGLFGLFQIWSFRHLDAVVSSGVGGGSLVYANVMLRMPQMWFDASAQDWPLEYSDIEEHYGTVEKMMGAEPFPPNMHRRVPKAAVFEDVARKAGMSPQPAPLAVTFAENGQHPGDPFAAPEDNLHRFQRRTCRLCGECDLGCNDGAKNTLDFTYLSQAQRCGAEIRPLHEVKRITAIDEGYELDYVVHRPAQPPWERVRRSPGEQPAFQRVRATTVVVAAGALGSTWLLLVNRPGLPYLSGQLGTRFSGNGDAIGFLPEGRDIAESPRGPVTTEYAQHEDRAYYLQDGGYPAILGWLGESVRPALSARARRLLLRRWWEHLRGHPHSSTDSDVSAKVAAVLGSARCSRSTLPLLAMGLDPAQGTMRLTDGRLDFAWPTEESREYVRDFRRLSRQWGLWKTMTTRGKASDSRFREVVSSLLSRNITAYPLGGCPMGKNAAYGVVDRHGEAFGHPGLFVADGSVLPAPVGANPSLTIAALAERFANRIVERSR